MNRTKRLVVWSVAAVALLGFVIFGFRQWDVFKHASGGVKPACVRERCTGQVNVRFLFHGSATQGIRCLEPRCFTRRCADEGAVVFATPQMDYAAIFMANSNDSWTQIFSIDDQQYFVCKDKQRLISSDHGGSIYVLPAKGFAYDPAFWREGLFCR